MNFPLLTSLRSATADLHQAVETKMNLLDPAMTEESYFAKLAALHAWAKGLVRAQPAGHAWDLDLSTRLGWLAEDLGPRADDSVVALEPLDASGWWGACYVVEGSSLGGQVLCRQLGARLPTRYFAGRGAETGKRWMSFLAALRDAEPSLDERKAVEGALGAFGSLLRS